VGHTQALALCHQHDHELAASGHERCEFALLHAGQRPGLMAASVKDCSELGQHGSVDAIGLGLCPLLVRNHAPGAD